ncbi:hypothetical protein NDK47_13205 [Brevibacillus ruminantium]|uniref:Uncharacterized protein n=1 Tax=Brevibacillus ruminantium TaxID=2950604 RepID=A0ABY4WLY7_9BACL|nr:hypothetical protein [Brevibacillus ruminantium]USG68175.1 hypothetical protein NDK47_13205 [Brevibacillus ruminantium]
MEEKKTAKNKQPIKPGENQELSKLGTHAAGATDLFQTESRKEAGVIHPPEHPGGAGSSGTY